MISVARREHKALLALHGWSGIVLGLLLLTIIATGTIAVFGEEIGLWSAGPVETRSPLTAPLDQRVKAVLATVPVERYKRIHLDASPANRLKVLLHGDPGPADRGVIFELTPGGQIVDRYEGLVADIAGSGSAGALSEFLVKTHIRLHVPNPWGSILTGAAGLAMMLAAISGFFIHRHLLADIFTLRRRRPVLANRDRHSVTAAWSLPFTFLLAFTGSTLSLAGSVGFPAIAWVSFGGDQQKLFNALIAEPPATKPTPAMGADLDAIIADATARAGIGPQDVVITNPGRADARVTVTHEIRDGEFRSRMFVFDGVTGKFLQERPPLGRVASAGGDAITLLIALHFGSFAGLASKLAWSALGFMTCFLVVSGMRLWLSRRERSSFGWAFLDRAISVVAFGLPLSVALAAAAYFLALPAGSTVYWTATGFIVGIALAVAAGVAVPRPALDTLLRCAAGLSLLALPLLRSASGGPTWWRALAVDQPVIVAGDIVVVAIGLAFALGPSAAWLRTRRHAAQARVEA